jgi:hypothetical protein
MCFHAGLLLEETESRGTLEIHRRRNKPSSPSFLGYEDT